MPPLTLPFCVTVLRPPWPSTLLVAWGTPSAFWGLTTASRFGHGWRKFGAGGGGGKLRNFSTWFSTTRRWRCKGRTPLCPRGTSPSPQGPSSCLAPFFMKLVANLADDMPDPFAFVFRCHPGQSFCQVRIGGIGYPTQTSPPPPMSFPRPTMRRQIVTSPLLWPFPQSTA